MTDIRPLDIAAAPGNMGSQEGHTPSSGYDSVQNGSAPEDSSAENPSQEGTSQKEDPRLEAEMNLEIGEDDFAEEEEEEEEKPAEDVGKVYPNADVRVNKDQYSLLHIKRLVEKRKELVIRPKYQREDVWFPKQRIELIESILMGIPLPVIYLFEDKEGKKQVVDGRRFRQMIELAMKLDPTFRFKSEQLDMDTSLTHLI